jgi:hypothetical protein
MMNLFYLCIVNILLILGGLSYAHDNADQHEIMHVYPLLEEEYRKNINAQCKMGILERQNCNKSLEDKQKETSVNK